MSLAYIQLIAGEILYLEDVVGYRILSESLTSLPFLSVVRHTDLLQEEERHKTH